MDLSTRISELLMEDQSEPAMRLRKHLAMGMLKQGADNSPIRHPLEGFNRALQSGLGAYGMSKIFGLRGPAPVSPSAAMTAYGNMPAGYTMPGMGGS